MTIDSIEEVRPESPFARLLSQITVCGRDQPDVSEAVANVAQPAKPSSLQHLEELGLDLQIDVADLIQKHCAVIGYFQQSRLGRHGAGERPSLVAKKFSLQEFAIQTCTVQVKKFFVLAIAVGVQPIRQHTFSGTGFTENKQRAV